MDASAYIEHPQWLELLKKLHLQEESMCEDRYHHVVHMVSAAYGAEDFYSGKYLSRYTFSSNHNVHKSLCDLCFWASDPLIDRFY